MTLVKPAADLQNSADNPNDFNFGRKDLLILVGLFLFALALRLIRLFDRVFYFDEVVLLYLARESFAQIWTLCQFDNFAPLFPWIVKLWTSVSWDFIWIRLLGALLGSLTPLAAYWLGKELVGRKLGIALGLASAVSVSLVLFSQYVRMFNVQPLLVCLSMLWFLKALESNSWKYWLLTALVNLIGFYVYYFMLIFVVSQGLVLVLHYRWQWQKYVRPLLASLPFLFGILIWITSVLQRYQNLNEGFWIKSLTWQEYIKTWIFLGSGTDFMDNYLLAAVLNLPFLIGIALALFHRPKLTSIRTVLLVVTFTITLLTLISLQGQSLINKRYFLFILPLYLSVALCGWQVLKSAIWRRLGLSLIWVSVITGLLYYYYVGYDFFHYHNYSQGALSEIKYHDASEDQAVAQMAAEVAAKIQKDEVIIHFQGVFQDQVIEAFFTSRYYHHYSLPEFAYSREEFTQYNGRQYMEDSERVAGLADFKNPPEGIWIITSQEVKKIIIDREPPRGLNHNKWFYQDNLFAELQRYQYQPVEILSRGKVSALHYRRGALDQESSVAPER